MRRHEIDRAGCRHLGGNDQVAFVLAVLVIDKDVHPAVARFVDDLLGADDDRGLVIGLEEGFEFGERIGGRVPAILAALAQGIGMEPSSAGKAGAGHETLRNERADFFDRVHTGWGITA